jgi:tetratricopeptide (TPR) repeat protein
MLLSFNTVRAVGKGAISICCFWNSCPGFPGGLILLAPIRIATLVLAIFFTGSYLVLAQSQAAPPPPQPFHKAQSPSPQTPTTNFEAAHKLMQEGKYDEALAKLQALASQNPKLPGLSHQLGAAYYKKGDFLKATGYLRQAIEENPKDSEAVQLLGLSYYLSGRPNEAIPFLEKVQTWYPFANVDAAYILGVSYIQVKNYPQARIAFARMFDVPEDSAASYLFTARMLLRQEFDPIAEEYAQKAVALDSKLPLAHFLLGELYLYKSRIPEAITEFDKEKAINPAHAPTYYKLADAYSRVQKFDDAERLLQRSIWLDATSTGPYILMGKVLEKKGEYDLAVRALQRAVTMDPNNSITHHLLGQAYRDLGRNEDAERELKLAEQLQERNSGKE